MTVRFTRSFAVPSVRRDILTIGVSFTAAALAVAVSTSGPLFAYAGRQAAALPAAGQLIPAKVLLRYKAVVGQTERSKHTAVMTVSFGGEATTLTIKEVDKLSFTKCDAATGDVTLESRTESAEMKLPDGSSPDGGTAKTAVETYVMHANNSLLSYATTEPAGDDSGESIRIGLASSVVFPDMPVTIGDKWSHDYKADVKLHTLDAHADFVVVGFGKVAGVDAFKIKMTYKETGPKPISSSGVHTIEAASGDEISSDSNFEGLDIGGQTATAKVHAERLDGGPLPGVKSGT